MKKPYNPYYDPLINKTLGHNEEYAPTYWIDSISNIDVEDDGAISQDKQTDVVVIGSGFTGLATAFFLVKEHGIKATVLDAN